MKTIEQLAIECSAEVGTWDKSGNGQKLISFTHSELTAFAEAYHAQKEAEKWIDVDKNKIRADVMSQSPSSIQKAVDLTIEAMLEASPPPVLDDFNLEYTCKRIRRLLRALDIPDPSDDKDNDLMGCLFSLLGQACSKVESPAPPVEVEPVAWMLKGNVGVIVYTDYDEAIKWQAIDGIRGKVELIELYPSPPDTEAKLKIAENEVAWLIEKSINGVLHYVFCDHIGLLGWTSDNLKAMRFSRKKDAMQLTNLMEDADRVAEHVWMGSTLKDIGEIK